MDIKKITHLPYRLLKASPSGLEKLPYDERDFDVGVFRWGAYTPKHKVHLIPTVSVKNQEQTMTCQWQATAVAKEIDEHIPLLVRSLVSYGKTKGLVGDYGLSNLRSGQKVLQDFGAADNTCGPEAEEWDDYINFDCQKFAANAASHKTSSYWTVNNRNDILRILDEGNGLIAGDKNKLLTTGLEWRTAYNQGGGFNYPWVIKDKSGYSVGGHAIVLKGYVIGYNGIDMGNNKIITVKGGRDVYAFQNSYGEDWGATVIDDNGIEHKGLFFIDMNFFDVNDYGCFANLDISVDTGKFLNKFNGKNVKGESPTIWHIQNGVKKVFPDWPTFLAFRGLKDGFVKLSTDEQEALKKIPDGDQMDIRKSDYFGYIQDIINVDDKNVLLARLIEISQKDK